MASEPIETTGDVAEPEAGRAKPKQRTSRQLKQLLRYERGLAKSSSRISIAIARGVATYLHRRDLSAERRRDGAFRDAPQNVARGVGETMRRASRAPLDIMKAVNSKGTAKRMRRAVRDFMRPFYG